MHASRFNLALLLMCLASSVCCAAQQRISGTVTDRRTHTPLKAATVKLEGDVLPAALDTTTDADGRFSFAGLSPARYNLSAAVDAFYAQALTLALAPREARRLTSS
ncbi:MAG TPA: carboxypeptidase-like regulatory domain-containing protein [Pyrinomonadaceae bacterium]|nr:carboxypeptidase-like regulatory domain-containing protein [Pyrinomonadaceae bacterium]